MRFSIKVVNLSIGKLNYVSVERRAESVEFPVLESGESRVYWGNFKLG